MELKILRFTIISTILFILKDISSVSSKRLHMPDMRLIKHRYANLLHSLVQVNVDRVETLKKLLKLYDYSAPKHVLRISRDGNDYRGPGAAEDDLNLLNNTVSEGNRFCSCRNTAYESDLVGSEENRVRTVNRENAFSDIYQSLENHRQRNDRSEATTSDESELSSHEKTDLLRVLINESILGNPVSQKSKLVSQKSKLVSQKSKLVSQKSKVVSKKSKLVSQKSKPVSPKSKLVLQKSKLVSNKSNLKKKNTYSNDVCIRPFYGNHDCKLACREAARGACNHGSLYCSDHLKRSLRKACKRICIERFQDPYDDPYYQGEDDD